MAPAFMSGEIGHVVGAMFSKDDKRLFLAVNGDKKNEASLMIFDVATGAAVTHSLTDHSIRFFRLGPNKEPWVLGKSEMRSISETGEPGDRRIALGKPAKGEPGADDDSTAFLDGMPGETLSLGNGRAAIEILNNNRTSRHKVALVDLNKLRIEAIITTMSAAEIARIRTNRILLAVALTAATAGNVGFVPNLSIQNEALAARPDGGFLFVLDKEAHAVTPFDVQSATALERIPVNKTVTKLRVSADGKHLICFGSKTQQIDLETRKLEN